MTNYNKKQNSILSFVAMAFLLYFIGVPLIIAVLMDYFGSVGEIITNIIDLIPFGKPYYELAIQIINSLGGQVVSYINMTDCFTIGYLLEELVKGLFTVIIFEALNLGACMLLGFVDSNGKSNPKGWNKAKYLLITVMNAFVAACLAPFPLNYIFSNLHFLGEISSGMISLLLAIVLVGGGITFFVFLYSLSIVKAIAYVLVKFFLIGACRISVSYVAIFAILIGWQQGVFLLSAGGVCVLLTIGLILGGIEMMLESVFS